MASPITEAIMQGVVASMDPMTGLTRQYMGTMMAQSQQNVISTKLVSIKEIRKELKAARKDDEPDQAVISCLEKLLDEVQKS